MARRKRGVESALTALFSPIVDGGLSTLLGLLMLGCHIHLRGLNQFCLTERASWEE